VQQKQIPLQLMQRIFVKKMQEHLQILRIFLEIAKKKGGIREFSIFLSDL
jgi:hypothetical protein